jgi:sec-independent protein translocase protein TatA
MGLFHNLTGWHALIILAVIILLFGATKLPALAKSVGQSMKIFKTEMRDATAPTPATGVDSSTADAQVAAPVAAQVSTPVATPVVATPVAVSERQ